MARVACGWRHSLAVLSSGSLYSFGWSKYGQLGHGDDNDQWLPRRVTTMAEPVAQAAGGWRHTAVISVTGKMFCWGWNRFGQVGNCTFVDTNHPGRQMHFPGARGPEVVAMACGWRHTIAVLRSGAVYSWGRGASGQARAHFVPILITAPLFSPSGEAA